VLDATSSNGDFGGVAFLAAVFIHTHTYERACPVSFEKKHSKVQTKNHSRFRAWGSVIVLFFSLSLHASIIANERVAFSAGVLAGSSRSPPSRFTQAILTALRDRQRHDKQNKKKNNPRRATHTRSITNESQI
jgi:hypothetical protein